MALSLSPQQLKQIIHTPSLPDTPLALQPYSTARQFTEFVHNGHNNETLSMDQREPQLSSDIGHATHDERMNRFTPSSQVVTGFPPRTPLRTLEIDEGASASDPKVDELSIKKATDFESATTQLEKPPTGVQATAINANATTAVQMLTSSFDATRPAAKRIRFEGVFITTKPLPRYKKRRSRTRSKHTPTSNAQVLTIVDALARTFNANRHAEDVLPRRSRTASHRHDDASTGPQTDLETTEAEDEQLQLNPHLSRTLFKRRHAQPKTANESGTSSGDAAFLLQSVPPLGRPAKRLKLIQYESNPALIDAALETVQAPISWDAGLDDIIEDEDFFLPAQNVRAPSEDVHMSIDEGACATGSPGKGSNSPSTPVGNEWRMPIWGNSQWATLTPYLSRGVQFRRRLDAFFGNNATVRMVRFARPKPPDLDISATVEEPDKELSQSNSDSAVSGSSASTAEAGVNAIPSTHMTSQSPDIPPADTNIVQPSINQLNEVDSPMRSAFDVKGEQMGGWIVTLQRLVKGKVHVKDEELETLSIILAEIESMKDHLDERIPTISELRESVKQLSELHEIPFGDRNKLRKRAENIIRTWPSVGKPGVS